MITDEYKKNPPGIPICRFWYQGKLVAGRYFSNGFFVVQDEIQKLIMYYAESKSGEAASRRDYETILKREIQ